MHVVDARGFDNGGDGIGERKRTRRRRKVVYQDSADQNPDLSLGSIAWCRPKPDTSCRESGRCRSDAISDAVRWRLREPIRGWRIRGVVVRRVRSEVKIHTGVVTQPLPLMTGLVAIVVFGSGMFTTGMNIEFLPLVVLP